MSADTWYRVHLTMDNYPEQCATYYTDDLTDARAKGIELATHYADYNTLTITPCSRAWAQTAKHHTDNSIR